MIKVLQIVIASHLVDSFGKLNVTGPERRAANLAGKWRSNGVFPVICYPMRGNLRPDFIAAELDVIDFEIGSKFNLKASFQLRSIAKINCSDLIHTQGPASLDLIAVFAGMLTGIPVVITRPAMIEDQFEFSKLRRMIYGIIDRLITLRFASQIIAVSSVGYKHLKELCGVSERKLHLVYNGIDLNRFIAKSSPECLGGNNDSPIVIGMVAQLLVTKGWLDFIEVIGGLLAKGYNVQGLIVGEGPLREEMRRVISEKNLNQNFEFTGYCNDVRAHLRSMDFLLFTSFREGLSVAVIEALATGLPVVATEVGGIREQVLDGVNGYVVKARNIGGMVNCCEKLINDRNLRYRMGLESRRIAEDRFSESRMLNGYIDCYNVSIGRCTT
jgi:glycosyltransferase involved in cell wall biosynthesis